MGKSYNLVINNGNTCKCRADDNLESVLVENRVFYCKTTHSQGNNYCNSYSWLIGKGLG